MDTLLQVAGLGLIAVLLGLVLKKGNGVLALLLTLAACAAMTVSIVRLAEPVVSFLSELRQLAGLEPAAAAAAHGRHRPSDTADGLCLRRCG